MDYIIIILSKMTQEYFPFCSLIFSLNFISTIFIYNQFWIRMFLLKLNKLLNPAITMGFSKLKVGTNQPKTPPSGLKAPPVLLKRPPINQNVKPTLTPEIKLNNLPKNLNANEAQVSIKQKDEDPQIKRKHAVVTVMGHVDHGKTTLIDYLRNSDIAQKQDGGITQRIGAFRINCLGQRITFIDTPGHEAFVNMRQRGASVTDLVVLIVSASEGVKKQTREVIQLIKKLQIRVIVAITKIDLPNINIEQVESELQKAGLKLEINGGNVPVVHISAKSGTNVDLLCQLIIQQTKNVTAVFNGMAQASVLEAYHTKEGQNSMTIIIQKGILKTNAILVMGKQSFRVKTILDDRGQFLSQAFPGEAVQVVGIPYVPSPGELVFEVATEKKAKIIQQQAKNKDFLKQRAQKIDESKQMNTKIKFDRTREGRSQKRAFCRGVREVWMNKFADEEEKILSQIEEMKKKEGNQVIDLAIMQLEQKLENHKNYVNQYLRNVGDSSNTLNFIIKFGDRGMEETILMQLQKLKPTIETQNKIKLNLIKTDVGDVTVSDIEEAKNCYAKIFTFGSSVSPQASSFLDGFEPPRCHKLIHTLLSDIKQTSLNKKINAIKGVERARCEVAEIYTLKMKKSVQTIPGIKVTTGKITKKCKGYIFREGVPQSEGLQIKFLKSFKKQMTELKKGQEGTIGFLEEVKIQKGDSILFYQQF